MAQRLFEAAQMGKVDELNDFIRSNELILEETALETAGHTPLHVACVAGHLDLVRELLKLKPKFAEKVNADCFSPLHIAAARGDVEITKELLRSGERLCFVKGRERRIPLHYAVINGELDVMKVLLSASPESIEVTTARKETVLHLAVKNNRFDAVILLVEHMKKYNKEHVISLEDHEGNTILHLAAAAKNFEVVKFMLRGHGLGYETVDVNALNDSGLTPLDVLTLSQRGAGDREIGKILARAGAKHGGGTSNSLASGIVLVDEAGIQADDSHQPDGEPVPNAPQSMIVSNKEKEPLADIRNALLVVAALIASATYQAVLQPPNFNRKVDDSSKKGLFGYSFFHRGVGYIAFISFNTLGFLVSLQTIICLTRDLPVRRPLLLSAFSMLMTYSAFMAYAPFASLEIAYNIKRWTLFSLLPITLSVLLLLTQRWLALFLEFCVTVLSVHKISGDMYNLRAVVPDTRYRRQHLVQLKREAWEILQVIFGKLYNLRAVVSDTRKRRQHLVQLLREAFGRT